MTPTDAQVEAVADAIDSALRSNHAMMYEECEAAARAAIAAMDKDGVDLIDDISRWQHETFPDGTVFGAIDHLIEEVRELRDAIWGNDDTGYPMELADVFLLTVAVADHVNCDLMEAARHKLAINKQRTWAKHGTYSKHVEASDE